MEPQGDHSVQGTPATVRYPLDGVGPSGPEPPAPSPTPARPELPTPTLIQAVEPYRLEQQIGAGGMGAIFRGMDTRLEREVAFKVLQASHAQSALMRRRFLSEARIAGRLQHPGVVPIYALDSFEDGRPFFAMRLVEGQTLAESLAARTSLTDGLPRFLKAFEQICQTMAYAHARRIIHRDLKPSNIMLAAFGIVYVMDWGISRQLGPEPGRGPVLDPAPGVEAAGRTAPRLATETGVGDVLGTPAYMSPEQASGSLDQIDERTDVFGLGAILCEILTGNPPYPGKPRASYARARQADLQEVFARLDASRAPREWVALARRCLAGDPDGRFRDGSAVARAVTDLIEANLRRAEQDLVRFFELSPDLLCLAGLDGYFRRVNANFPRVLGYPERELLTRPFIDFVHPADRDSTGEAVKQLSLGLPVVHFRNRYRHARGSYLWFEWAAKSIPDDRVIFAVARDVSHQVDLEDRLRAACLG